MPETMIGNAKAQEHSVSEPKEATAWGFSSRPYLVDVTPEVSTAEGAHSDAPGSQVTESSGISFVRMNWQLKAVLPIAFVLLNGLLLFMLATISWRDTDRHTVLYVAGAGAVAICAVAMFVLTVLVQRPIVELQEKMSQVGGGDLSATVSFAARNDEIGDLGRNFECMVSRLRDSRMEIQRLHETQMSRAEHLATLGELATGLAHEIRNPLAGIAGVVEIIGRDLPPSSPARAVVKDVRQEIAQINHILSDLLQTARPHPPEIRRSDLNTTVEHAVMLARQQAMSKPIEIEFQADDELPEVEHDSAQIHQVLLNLLLNSIQAMSDAGRILVKVGRVGETATVQVSDNGRGIPPEHLPNIFRPFYTTKGNGTGLGLSLARRIVEEHRGTIQVSSTPGKGTRFMVILPQAHA